MSNSAGDLKPLFNGADLYVREQRGFPGDTLVIYFSGRNGISKMRPDETGEWGPSPSEQFFSKNQIPAIFFYGHWNHWWQTPEMDTVIALLRDTGVLGSYKTIVTYGMSMGGYGALMYSSKFGAHRVIAGMPQYSIDPARMPEERRWTNDKARINFIYDDMEVGLTKTGEVAVFFDPLFRPDRLHVDQLYQHRPITALPVPFAIHGLGSALNDMGILSSSIVTMILEGVDPAWFRARVRTARRHSPFYLNRMARMLAERGRYRAAAAVDAMALGAINGKLRDDPEYMGRNGILVIKDVIDAAELLAAADRIGDAIALVEEWEARLPVEWVEEDNRLLRREIDEAPPVGRPTMRDMMRMVLARGPHLGVPPFSQRCRFRILADELLATRIGETFALLNQPRDAAFYFFRARPTAGPEDRVRLARRRVIGLAAVGSPRTAAALARELLADPAHAEDLAILLADIHVGPAVGGVATSRQSRVELIRRLRQEIRDLELAGSEEEIRAFDEREEDHVLENERLSVRFGNLLLKAGLRDRGVAYLRDCDAGDEEGRDALVRTRVGALLRYGEPEAARDVLASLPEDPAYDDMRDELGLRITRALNRQERALRASQTPASEAVV